MRYDILPGKYIVAVSGGVDSMVLLDILCKHPDLELVVAHFNHNIREDSARDQEFVTAQASSLGLLFEVGQAQLGPGASEADARQARYNFLEIAKDKHEADSIITAHHQDDQIETALINLVRGTGPRGLVSMIINNKITRPLLDVSKREVLDYAKLNKVAWIEDSTNNDPKYLRNHLRHKVLSKMTDAERAEILGYIEDVKLNYEEADGIMDSISTKLFEDEYTLRRTAFILLPDSVANEVIVRWLRNNRISVDRPGINRLVMAVKTAKPNSQHNIDKDNNLVISASKAYLSQHRSQRLI